MIDGLRAARRGFTLIELLVVISILIVLAGLSVVGLQRSQRNARVSAEKHTISLLKSAIQSFADDLGDYPPTTLAVLQVRDTNEINQGNESLFLCLDTRKKNGPYAEDLDESRWVNADDDRLSAEGLRTIVKALDPARASDRLLELTDSWGNPYVYLHNRDYGRKHGYRNDRGESFEVEAARNESTGGPSAPTSFQLWSLGPDGINQNGGGDDVCSWKS